MKMRDETLPIIPIIVTVVLCAGILISFVVAGTKELNATESVLLAILLSAASIMASWLITHIYSEINLQKTIEHATEANKENIRNYAVKAAEKVLNLSSELQRLSDTLNAAIEDSEDSEGQKESIMLLQQRIGLAVHNIETLRSMNDTFLSDWRGVIGDEIQKQHALETRIAQLADELDRQKKERDVLRSQLVSPDDLVNIENMISETEKRLTENLGDLPFKVTPRRKRTKKEDIVIVCPTCSHDIDTKFRNRRGGKKLVQCTNCEQYAQIIGLDDEEIRVSPVRTSSFEGKCPLCNGDIKANIPEYVGAMKTMKCDSCDMSLLLSRAQDNINIRSTNLHRYDFSEKIIENIRELLPEKRPWPTHIHKQIAMKLGYSNHLVSRVISHLISQGLYPLAENDEKAAGDREDE